MKINARLRCYIGRHKGNRQAFLIRPGWRILAERLEASQVMPRYFFHLSEVKTKKLVKDSEGALLSDVHAAKKEAIELARDIARHRFNECTWQIVVVDENAANVAVVSLSEIRPRKMQASINLIRRIVTFEPRFQPFFFTLLLTAVVFVVIMQAAALNKLSRAGSRPTNPFSIFLPKMNQEGSVTRRSLSSFSSIAGPM